MTDRIAEIRARVDAGRGVSSERELLAALDAAQARVRELEALCFDHADAGHARGRAEGFRAGAEAMREKAAEEARDVSTDLARTIRALPLPEPGEVW